MEINRKLVVTLVSILLAGGLIVLGCVFAFGIGKGSSGNGGMTAEKKCPIERAADERLLKAYPKTASENEQPDVREYPDAYEIENFGITLQMPELPTGCEITAMTMVLNYYGMDVDKFTMATEYLPTVPIDLYYGSDGKLYGQDLNQYFVGDPTTSGGYVCGPKAILTAANTYLQEQGSGLRAVNISGSEPEELYRLVSENVPVVVWATISMEERQTPEGWYTEYGEYVDWSGNDHGAVLIGYTEHTVTIGDPISGYIQYDRQSFEAVFASRDSQCVILAS